jgi:hypothetical protein
MIHVNLTPARGGPEAGRFGPWQPQIRIARRVVKGSSHLCAPNYCRRYPRAALNPLTSP